MHSLIMPHCIAHMTSHAAGKMLGLQGDESTCKRKRCMMSSVCVCLRDIQLASSLSPDSPSRSASSSAGNPAQKFALGTRLDLGGFVAAFIFRTCELEPHTGDIHCPPPSSFIINHKHKCNIQTCCRIFFMESFALPQNFTWTSAHMCNSRTCGKMFFISVENAYRVVRKKVTVLLSTSLAWAASAGCSWAVLFSQPCTNFFAQPCRSLKG